MKSRRLKWAGMVAGLAAVLVCCLLSVGCGSKVPQTITLTAPSNPTTGYEWVVTQDPELFDVAEEYVEDEHEEGMTGVGGAQVFTLTPKKAGTSEVVFTYARSWESSDDDATLTYTLTVSDDMQITTDSTLTEIPETMDEAPTLEIK